MGDIPEHFVKVRLQGPDGEIETAWAEPVGDLFRIENLPWFAMGISDGDLVEALLLAGGQYDFVRVVQPSGNRLVRVMFEDESDAEPVLARLNELGCSYEGANRRYFAVSVPPDVDLEAVRHCLISAEVTWEHANPTFEQLFPDQ